MGKYPLLFKVSGQGHSIILKILISRSSLIQVEPLRLNNQSFSFFSLKRSRQFVDMHQLIIWFQVILYGRHISFQFEISNKKLLFAWTKIITINIFDLLKWNILLIQKILTPVRKIFFSTRVLCHGGIPFVRFISRWTKRFIQSKMIIQF